MTGAAGSSSGRILRVVLGIMMALALHEIGGRLLLGENWTPEDGLASNALELTPSGFHATKPGLARATFANFSRRTPLFTDERGFRVTHPEHPRPADPKEQVLIIGASNTWGMGVPAERSWPFVMESLLAEQGWSLRVHNASGVGYTLPQMLTRASELATGQDYDRILIVTPGSGRYMFGLGSLGDPYRYVGYQAHQVDLLALEHPFDDRPELEEALGWLLLQDRVGRDGLLDRLRYGSLVGHRAWTKSVQRWQRLDRVDVDRELDEARMLGIARALGEGWHAFENELFARDVGLHHVYIPAEWRDARFEKDALQLRVAAAFQNVAQVGKRYFRRADLSGDPLYSIELDHEAGGDFLPDGRHLSTRGHRRVAEAMARWYKERIVDRIQGR